VVASQVEENHVDISLESRRALVCGSSRGIGRAIAEELATLGASVSLIARSEDALREVCAGLSREHGQEHHHAVVDASSAPDLQKAVDALQQAGNAFDILINNSGGPPGGPVLEAEAAAFEAAFRAHVLSAQLLVQSLLPAMKQQGFGRVLNVISTSVKQPIPGLGVSNTIRGAMASWAKTLAREVAPFGITVNNILPGFTETDRLASLIEGRSQASGRSKDDVANGMMALVPAGRFGRPAEIAAAAAFLASPAAGYINGINLPVDGGRLECL
jgi:3-oxoacyl-[acyl-carrier protein] reductase